MAKTLVISNFSQEHYELHEALRAALKNTFHVKILLVVW